MFAPSRALRVAAQLLKPAATLPSPTSSSATRKVPTRRQASEPSTPEHWRRVTKHRPPPAAPVLPPATPLRLPKPPFVQINNFPNSPPTRLAREDQLAEGAEQNAETEAQASRERKAYAASQVGHGRSPLSVHPVIDSDGIRWQDLARRVCDTATKELLVDTYPKLTPEALAVSLSSRQKGSHAARRLTLYSRRPSAHYSWAIPAWRQ